MWQEGFDSTDDWQGSYRTVGDKVYRYLQNSDTDANTFKYGYPVSFDRSVASGHAVDQPASARLEQFAGIVNNPVDPTDTSYSVAVGEWGWVCIYGTVEAYVDGNSGAIAAGASLKTADSSSKLVVDAAAGNRPTYRSSCTALEASTTDGEFINVHVRAKW